MRRIVALATISVAAAAALGVVFVVQGAGRSRKPPLPPPTLTQAPPIAFALTPPWLVAPASLPDVAPQSHGVSFAFRAPRQGLLLVYFGYTHCADVCPATLANISGALHQLPAAIAARVSVAFVTDDPRCDTAPVLNRYLSGWLQHYHALRTTDPRRFSRVLTMFRAAAQVLNQGTSCTAVEHTDLVYGIDPTGHVVAAWTFGVGPAQFARDFRGLLEHGRLPTPA